MATIYTDNFLSKTVLKLSKEIENAVKTFIGEEEFEYKRSLSFQIKGYLLDTYRDFFLSQNLEMEIQENSGNETSFFIYLYTEEFLCINLLYSLKVKRINKPNSYFTQVKLKSFSLEEAYIQYFDSNYTYVNKDVTSQTIGSILAHSQKGDYENNIKKKDINKLKSLQNKYNCKLKIHELEELYWTYKQCL